MIKTKEDLKRYLEIEKPLYVPKSLKDRLVYILMGNVKLDTYRFVKYLRYEEYHHNQPGIFHKMMRVYYWRKRYRLGLALGTEMWDNTIEEGLHIYHARNTMTNSAAKIGRNCILHGNNIVGNDGLSPKCPVLGNNVRLGYGAMVFGDVTIADDVTVAAGAIVVHSILEPGVTVAGIPAKIVKRPQNPKV